MNKTSLGLVAWVKQALEKNWMYMYGAYFDRVVTRTYINEKANQYPKQYTPDYIKRTIANAENFISGDCIGLEKAYLWLDESTGKVTYRKAEDYSADGMYNLAKVKGKIEAMPEVTGLAVRYSGHVGIYIGNGEVIEARGVNYGVVKTKLKDRPWTHWYEFPFIDYKEGSMELTTLRKETPTMLNDDVWMFQRVANYKYNAGLEEDSKFGGGSRAWCNKFKKENKLTEDGVCDKSTWDVLLGLTAEIELDGILKQLEDCREEVALFEKMNSDSVEQNTALTKKIFELKEQNIALQDSNAGLVIHRDSLRDELAGAQAELVGLKNKAIQLETELNSKSDWIKSQEEKLNKYEKVIIAHEQDAIAKSKLIESLNEKIENLEDSISFPFMPDEDEEQDTGKKEARQYSIAQLLKMIIDRLFSRS